MKKQVIKKGMISLLIIVLLGTQVLTSCNKSKTNKGEGDALDQVTLRTNWLWYGSHSIFFLGINNGYYKEQGIDLVVKQGNGSGSAVRLVANGDSTFAYASSAAAINLIATGAPIISVGSIDSTSVDSLMANPKAGINTPKDLEGKKVLTTSNAAVNIFFPLFLKNANVDVDKVSLVNVADSAIVSSYLEGLGDAIIGGADDKPSEIVANGGDKPKVFLFSDYGVVQPGYSIVASTELIKENPDLVRRFMSATIKSVKAAEADPDSAVQALVDWAANINAEQARSVLDVTLSVLYSPNNSDHKVGVHVDKDWESALELMKTYNDLETDKTAKDFYTNDFLP